ncbi:MAG: hypothetical protein PQJ47_01260 [Sphaerochaetaceae bacterium]|nr:hypothetical protein [Sphaerochaetaceae bacterium]
MFESNYEIEKIIQYQREKIISQMTSLNHSERKNRNNPLRSLFLLLLPGRHS